MCRPDNNNQNPNHNNNHKNHTHHHYHLLRQRCVVAFRIIRRCTVIRKHIHSQCMWFVLRGTHWRSSALGSGPASDERKLFSSSFWCLEQSSIFISTYFLILLLLICVILCERAQEHRVQLLRIKNRKRENMLCVFAWVGRIGWRPRTKRVHFFLNLHNQRHATMANMHVYCKGVSLYI